MHHFLTDQVDGTRLFLDRNDSRHISKVLRLQSGAEVSVALIGKGRYRCRLDEVNDLRVTASIVEELEGIAHSGPAITLLQAVPKGRKMDGIIRMVAELGVVRFIPVVTARCDVKVKDGAAKQVRWQGVARAAAKQSKALEVMQVDAPQKLTDIALIDADLKIVFWEEEKGVTLRSLLSHVEAPSSLALLIGPEGGLDMEEVERLKAASFFSASLGPKILRTETAPIVAVAQVIFATGSY